MEDTRTSLEPEDSAASVHEVAETPADEGVQSIAERLRKLRSEHSRTVDIDIPGYEGDLFCRYSLIDSKRINQIAERVRRTIKAKDDRGLAAALDTLIAACDEFFVRDNGEERPVREVAGLDTPVKYDLDLAAFVGFKEELPQEATARQVAMALFMGNDIAIAGHNAALSRWMLRNEGQLNEDFLAGEL